MGRLLFSFCPNCSSFPAESVKSQDHRVIIRVNYWITVKLPKYNHITAIILYYIAQYEEGDGSPIWPNLDRRTKKTLWYSYLNLTWFSMTYFVSSLTEFCAPLAVSLISYELLWCFCCIVEFSEYVTSEWWFSFHLCDVSSDLFGEDLIEKK